MYAIIEDRGRQATVRQGDILLCDLNPAWKTGDEVRFDRVLLIGDEGKVSVGVPKVPKASVQAVVLGVEKGEKQVVFRFKRRKNVRVKKGHRQAYSKVRITAIHATGA